MILTTKRIQKIFQSVSQGVGGHGGFLRALADTVIRADQDNLDLLKPSLEEIIKKYDLASLRYIDFESEGA